MAFVGFDRLRKETGKMLDAGIDVGRGPSGPSIEGPFCRTVHLCRTLEDRKMGKKGKKRKKIKKKKGKIEKRTERSEKKEKIAWI